MERLQGQRFLYVTGKGGVGKSTVSAALGAHLAAQGKRVLLVFGSDSLGQKRLLGCPVDGQPREVLPGFYAASIDPDESMKEYAQTVLKSRTVTNVLFRSDVARGFLHGVPGLRQWAFLGKAWFFAEPEVAGGSADFKRFDTVIVDAPATGHSTDVLQVPNVIRDLAPRGRLRRDADACWEMLHDPARSAVIPVSLLEDLPVTETEELVHLVRSELRLPLGPVFINQVRPQLFSTATSESLAAPLEAAPSLFADSDGPAGSPAEHSIAAARRRAQAEMQGKLCRERLVALGLGTWDIPRLEAEPIGKDGISRLAEALAPVG